VKRWEAVVLLNRYDVAKKRCWTREGAYRWMYKHLPVPAEDRREYLQWISRLYYVKTKRFEQWGTDYSWAYIRRI